MKCTACETEFRDGAKFCPKCGTSAVSVSETVACVACAKPVKAGAKFCPHCGASQMVKPVSVPAQALMIESVPVVVSEPAPVITPPLQPAPAVEKPKPAVSPVPAASVVSPTMPTAQPSPVHTAPFKPAQTPAPSVSNPSHASRPNVSTPAMQPEKRKARPLWLVGGITVVALAAGGAWYFGLIPGTGNNEVPITQQTPVAPPPVAATAVPETAPVEPPPILPEPVPPVEPSPAASPVPAIQPKSTASTTSPVKTQSQAVPSAKPALSAAQKSVPAAVTSTYTSQPQLAPQQTDSPKAELRQTETTVAENQPPARVKDPFEKCRRLTGYFERTFCEEKTRLKICQGKWGTTPECPKYNNGSTNE